MLPAPLSLSLSSSLSLIFLAPFHDTSKTSNPPQITSLYLQAQHFF